MRGRERVEVVLFEKKKKKRIERNFFFFFFSKQKMIKRRRGWFEEFVEMVKRSRHQVVQIKRLEDENELFNRRKAFVIEPEVDCVDEQK